MLSKEQKIKEINKELKTSYLKPERVTRLIKALKKLGCHK